MNDDRQPDDNAANVADDRTGGRGPHSAAETTAAGVSENCTMARRARSKFSNRLPFNMRSAPGRRLRDLILDVERRTPLDPARDTIVRDRCRAYALCTLRLEQLQSAAGRGEQLDDKTMLRLMAQQRELLIELNVLKDL